MIHNQYNHGKTYYNFKNMLHDLKNISLSIQNLASMMKNMSKNLETLKPKLRVIGDIHGVYTKYKQLIQTTQSICIGDMGFDYSPIAEPSSHKFFGGNHDNYDIINDNPNCLGDFGQINSPIGPIFFIRGAWSIDHEWRKRHPQKVIWDQEELTCQEGLKAIEAYKQSNAQIVLSHEAPLDIVQYVTNPDFAKQFGYESIIKTRTNQLLQSILEIRPPKLWCFGHYHVKWAKQIGPTKFICVNMEEYIDIYKDGPIYYNAQKIFDNW